MYQLVQQREDVLESAAGCCSCNDQASVPLARYYRWYTSVAITCACVLCHVLFWEGQHLAMWTFVGIANIQNVSVAGQFVVFPVHAKAPDLVVDKPLMAPYSLLNTLSAIANEQTKATAFANAHNATGDTNLAVNDFQNHLAFWVVFICSGIWPHLKLLLVQLLWYLPCKTTRRTTLLHWVDFFGKFSMVDVFFAVCLIAYVPFGIQSEPTSQLITNTLTNLPDFVFNSTHPAAVVKQICEGSPGLPHVPDKYQAMFCDDGGLLHIVFSSRTVFTDFVNQLEFHATGAVSASFEVAARKGLYFFSTAVWLTLIISAWVNTMDDYATASAKESEALARPSAPQTLLARCGVSWIRCALVVLLLCGTLATVCLAVALPSITRVPGGLFMDVVELITQQQFSVSLNLFSTIMNVADEGGDVNLFLQKDTFAFLLFVPVLFVLVSACVLAIPLTWRRQKHVLALLVLLSSFFGLDVLLLSLWMMYMVTPNFTKGLVSDSDLERDFPIFEVCQTAEKLLVADDKTCLTINMEPVYSGGIFIALSAVSFWLLRFVMMRLFQGARTAVSDEGGRPPSRFNSFIDPDSPSVDADTRDDKHILLMDAKRAHCAM